MRNASTPATHHPHHFDDLSPDDFERLVYWLLKRGAEFDEVQWYGGARDKGRDVVAHKHTPAGRETWYVQCKRYASTTFSTLRDELDKLTHHAARDPGFRPDVIVFATACPVPPQAGKTQLAVEFAYRYGRYFHGVHWFNAAQPATLEAQIATCGAAMALPNWPAEQREQVTRTLNEWQRVGPRLVILDNLEDVGAAREWLGRLSGGGLRLLLTARRSDWPPDLGLEPLPLRTFAPGESRRFLRRYLSQDRAPDAELDDLAHRLGHLPLALELAGRYLHRIPPLRVCDYVERLQDVWNHPSMRGWHEQMGSPTGHDLNLLTTFGVSWEQVQDEVARRLFLLAGHCAPNTSIPCGVLETATDLDREACGEHLSILTGLGLLEMAESAIGPLIHPLLAEYAKSLAAGDSEVVPVLADALTRTAKAANDRMDETGSPAHFAPLLAHMRLVAGAAEAEAGAEKIAATLWGNLGYYLQRVADYDDARAACERALAIDETAFGPDHPNVARDVNNLGLVLKDLGDLAGARNAFQRALRILEKFLPPDHPRIRGARRNLESLG
jgi:tetratricopeptide (TPR) repeat protein